MFQIVYHSKPTNIFEADDCTHILMQSRQNNPRDGITGALVFTGSHFVQALEGEEANVRKAYKRISKDPRHQDITCIVEEKIESAEFGRWSMAFERTEFGRGGSVAHQLDILTKNATEKTREMFLKFLEKTKAMQS